MNTNIRSDCHHLSLVNIIEKGKDKMMEMNIPTQRKNMKLMTECHDNFLLEAFNNIIEESNDVNTFPFSIINTTPTSVSTFIKQFDDLKRANDSMGRGYAIDFNQLIQR